MEKRRLYCAVEIDTPLDVLHHSNLLKRLFLLDYVNTRFFEQMRHIKPMLCDCVP